tara:strand:+ start:1816 stop:2691 length:876 start_codon:yes stop_codon:yes gene_type:complete
MKKVFSNTSEAIHVFAQQSQSEGSNQSRSVYFRENKIYSYGSHYLLGEFINKDTIVINDFGYSATTSKHISELNQATNHYKQFFTSSICIKSVEKDIEGNLKSLINARKPELYINTILQAIGRLNKWAAYCKETKSFKNEYKVESFKYRLLPSNPILKKLNKISNYLLTPDYLAKIKESGKREAIKLKAKNKRELKIKLIEFNSYKINRFNIGDFDYLRISENGLFVETSQSIKIDISEAKRLYFAIKNKFNIVGNKIGYYTVNKIDSKALIIGCHKIDLKSVISVGEQLI